MATLTMMSPYIMAYTALRIKGRVRLKPGFFSSPKDRERTGTKDSPALSRALRSMWM